jgi:putative ABC transport system ATP-binding protein
MSPESAVLCRGITKEFGSAGTLVRALRGVDLEIGAGELTLLVGPSGCGKTTLLSVIAGILEPTAGEVSVLGAKLERMSSGQKVRFRGANIGFVFQQFNLLPALSAVENVIVPLVLAGWPRRQALPKAQTLLSQMGMAERMHSLPSKLSGGQQQRVAIARALIHEPRLLVCDEPTSALDAHTGHTIMELLRAVAVKSGRAVVVVTHDSRVFGFGDRIVGLEDGRVTSSQRQTPAGGEAAAAAARTPDSPANTIPSSLGA